MKNYPRPSDHTTDKFGGPQEPWITREAVSFLDKFLNKNMIAVEFGSGSSTRWIANRVHKLISVENDPQWYKEVLEDIKDLQNVEYILSPFDEYFNEEEKNKCVNIVIEKHPDEMFDFVLVDGRLRTRTILANSSRVKSNGILMLDNVERYNNAQGIPWYKNGIEHMRALQWKETLTSNGIIQTAWWTKP